jgi:hypothetical protein
MGNAGHGPGVPGLLPSAISHVMTLTLVREQSPPEDKDLLAAEVTTSSYMPT